MGKPTTHDEFLASVAEPAHSALQKLREQIRAAAPKAEEYIGYAVPAFRQDGALVSYAAARTHLSFYVQSPEVMEAFAAELARFKTSKGAIAFTADKPIPAALVRKLVKARLAENAALRARK
jgi:uncharacterized protein YdhG (YjbR/CyaY superfamily)